MICDELRIEKACVYGPDAKVYLAEQVDAAIAELNARISDLEKMNHDLCERVTENDDIRLHWEEIEQTRAENERLNAIRKVHVEAIASMEAGLLQDDKEIRHHKFKRCLAMASTCRLRARWFGDNAFYKKEGWALKWHRRWLELAEKLRFV